MSQPTHYETNYYMNNPEEHPDRTHSKVYNLLLLDLFMHDVQPKRGQMAELNDKVCQQADKIIRSH